MAKENKKEISFVEGPIFQSLIRFALPVLGALILQAAYGAVDLLVVGWFGDASSISAVGTGSNFMQMVTKETKDVLAGKYGATVKPFNPEVQKKCIGDTEPITCRYADLLEPELPKLEKEIEQWKQQDEDVLTYALFPQVAVDFFKYREAQQTKVDPAAADKKDGAYPV